MYKNILILLLLFTVNLCFAQARIEFRNEEYDLGKIKEVSGIQKNIFKFKNIGNEPLKIYKIESG